MSEAGGYEAFAIYHGLKLHFTTSYDYVKYHGKITIGKDAFMIRKDKYFFYKLSRKYKREELMGFFISNLLVNPKMWIADYLSDDAHSEFMLWQRIQQSLGYQFDQDITNMFDSVNTPDELLKVVDGDYPLLYTLYMQDKVHLETLVIMNHLMGFLPMWKKKVTDDLIFPDFVMKVEKYSPFVNYDRVKFKDILKKKLCQFA